MRARIDSQLPDYCRTMPSTLVDSGQLPFGHLSPFQTFVHAIQARAMNLNQVLRIDLYVTSPVYAMSLM